MLGGVRQRQVGDRLPDPVGRHFNDQESGVELAVLGRLAAEMEYEPAQSTMQHDRPTPQELAEAVREFLQAESSRSWTTTG